MEDISIKEKYEGLLKEMESQLRIYEAFTELGKLLQVDLPIGDIVDEACSIAKNYLYLDLVGVVKCLPYGKGYEIVGTSKNTEEKFRNVLRNLSDNSIVLSDNMVSEDEVIDENLKNIVYASGYENIKMFGIKLAPVTDMFVIMLSVEEKNMSEEECNFVANFNNMLHSLMDSRISKNSLASSYEALKDILDNIGIGIYVVEKQSKVILFSNRNMAKIFGKDPTGHTCYEFKDILSGSESCENCEFFQHSSFYRESYSPEKNAWYVIKNNDIIWVDGRLVSLCLVTDVTEKKKYEKRIEFQANNDFLTGLYNRMRCEKDLNETISRAVEEDKSGMVMFIDLDNFKHLNDGLGHQYGDLLLKMISIGIQQIPGIENNCYRMGGDEFVILIEPENAYRSKEIIEAVEDMFRKPWFLNGTEYYCTMSMGVVCYPEDGTDVNELIKKADIAMYDAKKSGKNRVEYYNSEQEGSLYKRLDVENNMRSAVSLGCDEFKVYIQPIFDAKEEKCLGGEALIRWDSSNLGFLGPGDFIPLAENLGLINSIGEYFLENACRINKIWSDHGVDAHINVNLSIVQLMQNSIVDRIRDIIQRTEVNPNNLYLEVTESLAINDMNRMKKILAELKELGVNIALDDFGTGYSSLNYIKQMSFDVIKVDKSFIDDIVDDDYSKTFVKLITELSEQLGVKVCVEGVETRDQIETLKKMDVAMIQGYYYGKPIPYDEFQNIYLNLNI